MPWEGGWRVGYDRCERRGGNQAAAPQRGNGVCSSSRHIRERRYSIKTDHRIWAFLAPSTEARQVRSSRVLTLGAENIDQLGRSENQLSRQRCIPRSLKLPWHTNFEQKCFSTYLTIDLESIINSIVFNRILLSIFIKAYIFFL